MVLGHGVERLCQPHRAQRSCLLAKRSKHRQVKRGIVRHHQHVLVGKLVGVFALQELFEQNKDVFNGASVRARHILLTVSPTDEVEIEKARLLILAYKKQVEDTVKAEMAKLPPTADNLAKEKARIAILDETFAIIAKDKSTCPSKDQGGDVGWFTRDGVMV